MNEPPEEGMMELAYTRPTWDEYFMEVCRSIAKRATCDRGRSGCVIARDHQILATGYVGAPAGLPHCDEVGHQLKQLIHESGVVTTHCVRTVHAEQNAICQAARRGIAIGGATLYCRMTPCRACAMMIVNCGIVRVVCERKYHDGAESEAMFAMAGVAIEYVDTAIERYDKQ
jgi:dCMP deaminase